MKPFQNCEPSFTPEEKAAAIQLLRQTQRILARYPSDRAAGRPTLICNALKRGQQTQAMYDVQEKVQALIKCRLGRASTVRHWLLDRGFKANGNDIETFKKLQDTRFRWLGALIEEFEPIQENPHETNRRERVRDPQRVPRKTYRRG